MIKIKCVSCGISNVYNDERDAYLDGWYYIDGYGNGFPYNCHPVEICQKCQKKEIVESVTVGEKTL